MKIKTSCLMIALAVAGSVHAKPPRANSNEAATARHFASLVAGAEPKTAELTMFFSQMPKGADLHHHYSGSIYAEQYVQWLDPLNYCVNMHTYRIETKPEVVEAQRAKPLAERSCLGTKEVLADDYTYRELLQRWSSKDFDNHGAIQPPPDRQFFQTFGFFGAVSNMNFAEGLQELKKRAIQENISYIETMFKMAPGTFNAEFDGKIAAASGNDAALTDAMRGWAARLEQDAAFDKNLKDYVAKIDTAAAGIDDERFTMRYQNYVVRLMSPSLVFSSMVLAFKAAEQSPLIVGVNIVGQESAPVSMRDYALHMKMFQFLKTLYPNVKLALHAGELALGDVPPDGLRFHIDQALHVAGASRIGHGLDLAHESNAAGIMKTMRERDIPVEINLTSNSFISGIRGDNHPLTIYRKYGVPYVISTDDAGVTRHTLAQEYMLFASRYKPGYAEVKKASYNGLKYSFLEESDKARLKKQLDARFAAFEANIAALAKAAKQ